MACDPSDPPMSPQNSSAPLAEDMDPEVSSLHVVLFFAAPLGLGMISCHPHSSPGTSTGTTGRRSRKRRGGAPRLPHPHPWQSRPSTLGRGTQPPRMW